MKGGYLMAQKITLSDVCDELYKQQQEKLGNGLANQTKEQRKNFLSKNVKYLNEIFKAMQIADYMRYIKPNFQIEENGYEFSQKSLGFLVDLLDKYTDNNVLELRRGHLDKVSDRCVVWIVEGLYKMFKHNGVPEGVLSQIGIVMSNYTDYPVRLRYGKMFQMTYDLEQMASKPFLPKWLTNLNGEDNCLWLDAMQEDLKLFIAKWRYIYGSMGECRQDEVNNLAEEGFAKMTANQILRAEIEFDIAEELNKALEKDEKLKQLNDEMNKEIVYKKTGYYADKLDSFEYMKKRIRVRTEEVEQAVFEKYCNGIEMPLDDDIIDDTVFDNMKSSKTVLEEAIDDYHQWILPRPKMDLPDIDIDEIIAQFRMEQALKKKEH